MHLKFFKPLWNIHCMKALEFFLTQCNCAQHSSITKWLLPKSPMIYGSLNPVSLFLVLMWPPRLVVTVFDVFLFNVCVMMSIFFASSHTYFRQDLRRTSKCDDRFKVKSWCKIEQGLFSCPFFKESMFFQAVCSWIFCKQEKNYQKCLTWCLKKISADYSLQAYATK